MCICINLFTEYAVYDSPAEYYRRTLAIPLLDCIISELDSRFSYLSRTASNILYLVLRWPGRSQNKAVDIEHCAVDIKHCAVDIELCALDIEHCALDIEQLT